MAGITVIGDTRDLPLVACAAIIDVAPAWGYGWDAHPELELVSANVTGAGHDLATCVIRSRYGRLKYPYESAFSTRTARSLEGWWLRLRLVGEQGLYVSWIGQISSPTREVYGSNIARTGIQTWVAYGPRQILRKTPISESVWLVDGQEQTIGWVPHMNARDRHRMLVGNRSAAKSGATYVYGGTDLWTHYQVAEYILNRFVDQSAAGGPAWRLGGQTDLLESLTDTVSFGTTQTADEVLQRLINPRFGIDFTVLPTEDGFEVHVSALQAAEYTFGGATLPRNPYTVRIEASEAVDMVRCHVVESHDQRFGRIRLLGGRILICCSLGGEDMAPERTPIEAKWTATMQWNYDNGTGNPASDPAEHDRVRQQDVFRPVYQAFGAPVDWGYPAPLLDADGSLAATEDTAHYQTTVRTTETWIPLREGYDYSADPPTEHKLTGAEPEFQPPAAWVYDADLSWWVPVEWENIGIAAMPHEWGLLLSASPNHLLALNHWGGGTSTQTAPAFDYETLVITIAFYSDQRLIVVHDVPGGDDTTIDIEVPDAELWYLAPDTVIDVADDGLSLQTAGPVMRILRNDNTRLAFLMAGAIARYAGPRARAEITLKGLVPWGGLVGDILTVVEEEVSIHEIDAPITAVEWHGGPNPTTVIKAGFAR